MGEFIIYEVLGMLYYHFCLKGDYCGISISPPMMTFIVIPAWFAFVNSFSLLGRLKQRDFPEDKDILHLVVEALYAVLWFCVIAAIVCLLIMRHFMDDVYGLV